MRRHIELGISKRPRASNVLRNSGWQFVLVDNFDGGGGSGGGGGGGGITRTTAHTSMLYRHAYAQHIATCTRIYLRVADLSQCLVSFGGRVGANARERERGAARRDEARRDAVAALSLSIIFPRYRTASRLRSHRTDCERLVQLPRLCVSLPFIFMNNNAPNIYLYITQWCISGIRLSYQWCICI